MTPSPPEQAFLDWWSKHPHSGAITAAEAWLCKCYREEWRASRQDDSKEPAEHWWQR
jgi:hypothetical protein